MGSKIRRTNSLLRALRWFAATLQLSWTRRSGSGLMVVKREEKMVLSVFGRSGTEPLCGF